MGQRELGIEKALCRRLTCAITYDAPYKSAFETRPSLQAVVEAANPTALQFTFSVTNTDSIRTCSQSDTPGFGGATAGFRLKTALVIRRIRGQKESLENRHFPRPRPTDIGHGCF
jgi:hypothetical protein